MFNRQLLDLLIFRITFTLSHSTDPDKRKCWCDEIQFPHMQQDELKTLALQFKQVIAKTWIDEGKAKDRLNGQHMYDLHINFGEESLQCLKLNVSLMDCVPETLDWLKIDMNKKVLEVQLM